MLLLSGRELTQQAVVVKVARHEAVVASEVHAPARYLAGLGPFGSIIAQFDPDLRRLSTALGVYYRQVHVGGLSLLELLQQEYGLGMKAVQAVTDLCIDVCSSASSGELIRARARDFFRLSPVDSGRFESSVNALAELGATMEERGMWPEITASPIVLRDELLQLIAAWPEHPFLNVELPIMVQHGDLNPGNIIVKTNGGLALIDMARLGPWPIGYDLGRLALMLWLRLVDCENGLDHFPDRIGEWCAKPPIWVRSEADSSQGSACEAADHCHRSFAKFVAAGLQDQNELVLFGYRLGILWDLVKVVSYQDLSWCKRLWAALEAQRIVKDLRAAGSVL